MKRIQVHALPLRIWHWLNALIVVILLITGFQLRISGVASLRPHDPAIVIHKYAGWAMVGLYAAWFVYSLASRNLRNNYAIGKLKLNGVIRQTRFYLFSIFRGDGNPFSPSLNDKYNPLQKIAYISTMFMLSPIVIITGLSYADIGILRKYMLLWNMAGIVSAVHIIVGYMFSLFLIIHVYMSTLGPTPLSYIRAMITGYEEIPDENETGSADEVSTAHPVSETGTRIA